MLASELEAVSAIAESVDAPIRRFNIVSRLAGIANFSLDKTGLQQQQQQLVERNNLRSQEWQQEEGSTLMAYSYSSNYPG